MATGAGFGGLITALVPLVGIVSIIRGRIKRKRGLPEPVDESFEKRKAAERETERRMKAYLAQRSTDGYEAVQSRDEQETKR